MQDVEARLTRTEQHLQSLQGALAVEQARQSERAARVATLEPQVESARAEVSSLATRIEAVRSKLATASAARTQAGSRLEVARETLRTVSQQADRLQGALAALGAADLDQRDDADLPSDWQAVLQALPVVGRARELAARIRPIDLVLSGYLQRIVVLATDEAAREAFNRLGQHLPASAAAWGVMSIDGLLLAAGGERPVEVVGDAGQSILANWAQQVRRLESERAEAETSRRAAVVSVQGARDALDDAEATERSARMALSDAEARLAELRRGQSAVNDELQRLRGEHERAARAAAQRADERERSSARADAVHQEREMARAERDSRHDILRGLDETVARLVEHVGELRSNVATHEALAGRREAERAAREALHARIRAELATNSTAQAVAADRLASLGTTWAELNQHAAEFEREQVRLTIELEPVERELKAGEQSRLALLDERQRSELRLSELRAAEWTAREHREAQHVAAQRAADDVDRLNLEIEETTEVEAEPGSGVTWAEQLRLGLEGEPGTNVADIDLDAARRRIATLQRELRAVGGVAESVVQEYREMSERHSFLERQSEDLRVAQAELHAAANELETHMRERFAEAFGQIQQAFQECFSKLFGGGEARLVLTDPDDLLRTGIDIVARPPGKKLQNLLSLSGGERALTIVSLLFGLLQINPTPFCVLDEVDAALDEANVQRFANLLAEFARQIQFIVVTHNRATMDKADAIYGISMDAQSVSHVFSVKPRAIAAEPVGASA
jgi:chromosome segregation protein